MFSGRGIKLWLAAVWLLPGVGLLAIWAITGQRWGQFPIGTHEVPADLLMLAFGVVNLMRWRFARPAISKDSDFLRARRHRPHRLTGGSPESDPTFNFTDPQSPG